MPKFYTDTAALQSPTPPKDDKRAQGSRATADVFMLVGTYTLLGSEAATDIIEIGTAPAGSRVIPHLCKVVSEVPGTTFAGVIGDAADDDRYSTSLDIKAGGVFDFAGAAAGSLTPFHNSVNTPVLMKLSAASVLVVGRKITFYLAMSAQN